MLTMTTKEFRNLVRAAKIDYVQMYTNPCVQENVRNVGVMVFGDSALASFKKAMVKAGHDPKQHGVYLIHSRHSAMYIRCKAKFEP